jgi:ABC-type polysaccharide/polyol phosphate export permease
VYVACAIFALYLNCFVLIVQSFQKISFLHALAPTQKEPPFAIAQGALLILFVGLGVVAFRKFRPLTQVRASA